MKTLLVPIALVAAFGGHLGMAQVQKGDSGVSPQYLLGQHYQRVEPTSAARQEGERTSVVEFFWYGCIHCRDFDPHITRWERSKPEGARFTRVPATWYPTARLHARAFYAAQLLGKSEEMHDSFFEEIVDNHNKLDTEEKLAQFFERFGVAESTFKEAFDSTAVQEMLTRADQISRRYRVRVVPTIVVNGEYMSDSAMAGSTDALIEVLNTLIELSTHDTIEPR